MNHDTAIELRDYLAAALPDVLVTTDPAAGLTSVQSGTSAVVINPPTLTFETNYHVTAEWQIWLVPGSSDRDTGWAQLDAILATLAATDGIDGTTARPADWQPANSAPLIAYDLTITTDHNLT